jgi:hypothetical protein
MKAEGGKRLSNNAGGRSALFILHPSAFILQKSARAVGNLLLQVAQHVQYDSGSCPRDSDA